GVDSILAIDPQNALLVRATAAGHDELTRIIGLLDRVLRQVEIEAQFVRVSTTDSRAFGIDFNTINGPFTSPNNGFASGGTFVMGYVRNNFQAVLRTLLDKKRAKVVNSPRIIAINNLTASLQSQTVTVVELAVTTTGIGGQVSTAQVPIQIPTSIGL